MSQTEKTISTDENAVPTDENNVPTNENTVPTDENTVPTDENTVPTDENTVPTDENTVPTDENIVPPDENIVPTDENTASAADSGPVRSNAELIAVVEALIFVADEPITVRMMSDVIEEEKERVQAAVEALREEYETRESGLRIREVGGGWQIATRTELHETVRRFLKTKPSAKLSLAALETLAVIAYKQPVTIPEILEIRGVQSVSAIKTLLEKRLIVTKGHKETVGRPMQYGTSKEFLIQFGLKDLSELPSIEDFEDVAGAIV